MQNKLNKYADYVGITGSTLCLIHCILTSGMALASAMFAQGHGHHHHTLDFWGGVDLSMVGVSIVAVYFATKTAHFGYVKKMLWGFLSLFVLSVLLKFFVLHAAWVEVASWIGSIGLIASHFVNMYTCRKADQCELRTVKVTAAH